MDEYDIKFWGLLWKLLAVCFIAIVASGAGCTSYDNYLLANLLKNTPNPVAMRCAYQGVGNKTTSICTLAVQNERKP